MKLMKDSDALGAFTFFEMLKEFDDVGSAEFCAGLGDWASLKCACPPDVQHTIMRASPARLSTDAGV
jgi:hypothetical protein